MIHRAIVVSVFLLAGTAARAQPVDPGEAAYREGRRLYDLREWDEAIARFKEAYRLRSDAASLFNIAQAYRLKGDCVEAVSFYKTYKRNFPTEKNLAKVDRFITELEPCAAQQAATKLLEPVTPEPELLPSAPDLAADPAVTAARAPGGGAEPMDRPGRTQRLAGIAIATTGVVAIGTGVVFALRARSFADDAESGMGTWDPSIERSGERAARTATILWGAGTAAVIGGGLLYWLDRRSSTRGQLGFVPRHDGAALVWSCEH